MGESEAPEEEEDEVTTGLIQQSNPMSEVQIGRANATYHVEGHCRESRRAQGIPDAEVTKNEGGEGGRKRRGSRGMTIAAAWIFMRVGVGI